MKNQPRIGILGGTFNPVHIGHLILAQEAVDRCEMSKLLFVPCARPPHKSAAGLADAAHRCAMIRAAIEGDLRFEVSTVEIERGGVSYTIDTIRELQKQNPRAELLFIIGSDTLPELHTWKDVDELLKLCRFVTFSRPGFDAEQLTRASVLKVSPDARTRILAGIIPARRVEVSSSDIRHRIAEGLSIRYLVPHEVEMYILEHRLYRS